MHSFDEVLRTGNFDEFVRMLRAKGVDPFQFFQGVEENDQRAERKECELVGCMCQRAECQKCDLSEDECKTVFNSDLSFEEKKAKLQVLRGEIQVKPKSFRKRLSQTDSIHARALGIRL